jgi:histidinol-phosphate aminotransferase
LDRAYYPDPGSNATRKALAALHGIDPARIVIGASASELIQRITAFAVLQGCSTVICPAYGYTDYSRAAKAHRLALNCEKLRAGDSQALQWWTMPSSPAGKSALPQKAADSGVNILDLAYWPMRLCDGHLHWRDRLAIASELGSWWQLWSPNKSMGLAGVRGAYLILPPSCTALEALRALAPSWPVGIDGDWMLRQWASTDCQQWLHSCLDGLRGLRKDLADLLLHRGWRVQEGDTHYVVAQPPHDIDLQRLRERGIKLRVTALPGTPAWLRLRAMPPPALWALEQALE